MHGISLNMVPQEFNAFFAYLQHIAWKLTCELFYGDTKDVFMRAKNLLSKTLFSNFVPEKMLL